MLQTQTPSIIQNSLKDQLQQQWRQSKTLLSVFSCRQMARISNPVITFQPKMSCNLSGDTQSKHTSAVLFSMCWLWLTAGYSLMSGCPQTTELPSKPRHLEKIQSSQFSYVSWRARLVWLTLRMDRQHLMSHSCIQTLMQVFLTGLV